MIGGAVADTTIELAAEASRPAANDLAHATVFAEVVGSAPGEAAKRVNALIADALATAKAHPPVKAKSAGTHTYPVRSRDGQQIESWRVRSEIALESVDITALSELLGKLQAKLGVSGVSLTPSPATREKAEREATLAAIAAFRERAQLVAGALGKPYRIKYLNIGSQGYRPPMPMLRTMPMAAAAEAPMPLEAGDSQITANVSGRIELDD
jgi:predicted secreted protein